MSLQRTIVYVDGFNLYFGSLKNTPYKWLDLKALFSNLLGDMHLITEIKYYTARISSRGDGDKSPERQKLYLKALAHYTPELKIYYGHYLTNRIKAKVCDPKPNDPAYVNVFKTEEKGSDVNLALHMLRNDARLKKYDCAVLVSNDSDLSEALRFVSEEHNLTIGLIVPGNEKYRKISHELGKYAKFKHRISNSLLEKSQLPNSIPNSNFYRPLSWQ